MGYNTHSNLVKLIDMDLNLEEFENAFKHNEVCENMIWNLGTSQKRLWVQTHWCACESHVSLLLPSLTWGCQQLVNHVYYCASKRKIACYLRNLTCHNCQVRALQGHYDVRSYFRGQISNKIPWFSCSGRSRKHGPQAPFSIHKT